MHSTATLVQRTVTQNPVQCIALSVLLTQWSSLERELALATAEVCFIVMLDVIAFINQFTVSADLLYNARFVMLTLLVMLIIFRRYSW